MQRLLLVSILLVGILGRMGAADEEGSVKRTFRIDLSVREPMKIQDWSGKVEFLVGLFDLRRSLSRNRLQIEN